MLKLVSQVMPSFDEFWNAYPKKVAKKDAMKAFSEIKPDPDLFGEILQGIERHKKSLQWQNRQYIPHPATYLRGERWTDELDMAEEKPWWMQ